MEATGDTVPGVTAGAVDARPRAARQTEPRQLARVSRAARDLALPVRGRFLPHASAALLRGTRHALCGEGSPAFLPQSASGGSHWPAALHERAAEPLIPTGHAISTRCSAGVSGQEKRPDSTAGHASASAVSPPRGTHCTRRSPPPRRPSARSDDSSARSGPRDTPPSPSVPRGSPARSATPAARWDTRALRWRRNASPTAQVLHGTPLAARQTRAVQRPAAARARLRHRLARGGRWPLHAALLDGLALCGG